MGTVSERIQPHDETPAAKQFGSAMTYRLAFVPETSIQEFQSVRFSTLGQCNLWTCIESVLEIKEPNNIMFEMSTGNENVIVKFILSHGL